jgi:hypothetical protein
MRKAPGFGTKASASVGQTMISSPQFNRYGPENWHRLPGLPTIRAMIACRMGAEVGEDRQTQRACAGKAAWLGEPRGESLREATSNPLNSCP